MHAPALPALSARQLWLWPRVALVLFVAAVIGLMAYLRQSEREEARLVLISDVLWIEQNLRFQFDQTEERLRALLDAARRGEIDEAGFAARARLLAETNPAIVGVRLSAGGRRWRHGVDAEAAALDGALRFARGTGRPGYSDVLGPAGYTAVALAEGEREAVALISLPKLLAQQVPWWFATKYRLAVLDGQGREVASKSAITTEREALSYQLTFDPPGHGLALLVTAYRAPTGTVQKALIAAVLVLAVLVLLSGWRLQRQIRGRLSAEAALREEHAFRTAMGNSLAIGMRARDLAGRIIYVNPAFCRMVGFEADELIGTLPPYPYWNPADLDSHQAQNEAVLAGRAPQDGFESTIRHRDGRLVATRVYATPLIDAAGRQRGWLSSVVDITAQKAAEAREREQEEKLRQTGRLIAMGEMASTLAHELNQPLMAMSTYASAARKLAGQDERELLDSTLVKIGGQAQRAAEVVRRIREFVRKRAPHREPGTLDAIVADALELIEPDARARSVRLTVELAAGEAQIEADRVLIGQVVINLLRNAIDACAPLDADRRDVRLVTTADAETVQLTVCDRGPGIAPEIAEQLFEAFFTTKPLGMGIGLSICRSIVEQHHGKLWFEPAPAGGACFHVSLPR